LKTTGLGESAVEEKIAEPLKSLTGAGLEIGYCARTAKWMCAWQPAGRAPKNSSAKPKTLSAISSATTSLAKATIS